jgi:alpha-N-acetylglucosaminidase
LLPIDQELQPNITGLTNRTGHHGTALFYDTSLLTKAWEYLVNETADNPSLLGIAPFHNDVVDITRQVFANAFINVYDDLLSSWNAGNITGVQSQGLKLIALLTDLDLVLATDETFILGKWIADARRWSNSNDLYANYLEYNARNQVTLWGPSAQINDYGSKQWAGLISSYYIPRYHNPIWIT